MTNHVDGIRRDDQEDVLLDVLFLNVLLHGFRLGFDVSGKVAQVIRRWALCIENNEFIAYFDRVVWIPLKRNSVNVLDCMPLTDRFNNFFDLVLMRRPRFLQTNESIDLFLLSLLRFSVPVVLYLLPDRV